MKCRYFDDARCRSCSELVRPYAEQLADKQARAAAHLPRAAGYWLPPVASAESGFRNKAKMAVGGSLSAPTLGLLDPTGTGIDLQSCALYPPSLKDAFGAIRDTLIAAQVPPYSLTERRGEAKYVLLTQAPGTGELLLRFVLRSNEAIGRIQKQLPNLLQRLPALRVVSVNLLPEHKAVTEGDSEILLTETRSVRCLLNDIELHLTPRSFLQTHSAGAAALYASARAFINARAPAQVWDLYCGIGGFALHAAAPGRRVIGIESTAEAITAAGYSDAQIQWVCADASDWARAQAKVADCIIVNPPRRGIGAPLATWLNRCGAGMILYSSCNVESLARDLSLLPDYRITAAQIFDLFPHTTHFETLLRLEREPTTDTN